MAIYLDIETLDFFSDPHIKALPRVQQIAAMRFGCAVTHQTDEVLVDDVLHRLSRWTEWRAIGGLYEMLVECGEPIVGWNIVDFDIPVIVANAQHAGVDPTADEIERLSVVVDLFSLIRQATGRWYSLETVAQHNLGRGKLADGQLAAEWLRSGDPEMIAKAMEYCRYDVQLTIDLHAILMRGEPLRLPPRAKRQELNEILWWLDGRTECVPDAMGDISTR